MKVILPFFTILLITLSCQNKVNSEEVQEKQTIHIVNNEDQIGSHGEGTYINTNSDRKCEYCGRWVNRNDIHHGFNGECQRGY